jgi:hypothetical protein
MTAPRHRLSRHGLSILSAIATAGIVGGTLAVHGWQAVRTAYYINPVTGVWLALARDLADGVFYRDLIGPAGYGGTRYFPVFFSSLAALIKLGIRPLAAGFAVSIAAACLLSAAVERLLARLGVTPALRVTLAALVLAAPSVQQTLFFIRSDLLATGFAVLGLAWTLPRRHAGLPTSAHGEEAPDPPARSLALAALFLTLAVATKVTSLYAPAAALLALALAHRSRAGLRLGLWLGAWGIIAALIVQVASDGRALASFRACALGGSTAGAWMSGVGRALVSEFLGRSRLLSATLVAGVLAWVADARHHWRGLPSVLFLCTIGTTAAILASPGTIPTNQTVDLYVAALVAGAAWVARHPRSAAAASVVAVALALASVRPNLEIVRNPTLQRLAAGLPAGRERAAALVDGFREPVLCEAPELPVMAGRRPYLIDPFALRVVMRQRPDIERDLVDRVNARWFTHVILVFDPLTPGGRGWYTNVDFGWPVTERILANYQLQAVEAGFRIYRPRFTPQDAH